MYWKTKARIFRALSAVPFGAALHFQLQRHVTKEWPRRPAVLDQLIAAAKRVRAEAPDAKDFVEIGAGRDLSVALAIRLLGAPSVTCVDISRYGRLELINHAANYISKRLCGFPLPPFRTWRDLEGFGIRYMAPSSLEQCGQPPGSFDCFYSVDTLEHVPAGDLPNVLACGKRLLRDGGCFVHFIDYSDHYARGDELSRLNFLTFSDSAWEQFNSRFQYVNRLRHSEFVRMFEAQGFTDVRAEADEEKVQQSVVDALAPQFRQFALSDLFTTRAIIVAR